jgi:ribosomal protein S5
MPEGSLAKLVWWRRFSSENVDADLARRCPAALPRRNAARLAAAVLELLAAAAGTGIVAAHPLAEVADRFGGAGLAALVGRPGGR